MSERHEYVLLQSLPAPEILQPIALIEDGPRVALLLEPFAGESLVNYTRSAGRTMFRHDALQCSAPPQIMPSIMFYCFISSQIALQLMAYILLIKS